MRTPSFLISAATALALSGCATDASEGSSPTAVSAKNAEHNRRLDSPTSEGKKPDPCAELIKTPEVSTFYKKWRMHFDGMMQKATPAPKELHDPMADMCEMVGPGTNFLISRDGQFAGYEIKPHKPDLSHRVTFEMVSPAIDAGKNIVPGYDGAMDASTCQRLVIDTWKEWEKTMPNPEGVSETPQWNAEGLNMPCDPTETATIFSGGCWYEAPSPENGNQRTDGCGGGGSENLDRQEVMALMKCVREMIHDKGVEMCL